MFWKLGIVLVLTWISPANACLGGVCNDDDDTDNGVVLPPAKPRTAAPTISPTPCADPLVPHLLQVHFLHHHHQNLVGS